MEQEQRFSEEELERDKWTQRQKFDESRIRDMQRGFFGSRNVGASLSSGRLNTVKWPEVSKKISAYIKNPKGFLLISAPPGIGKTYFLSAMFGYLWSKGIETYCINERELMERLRQGIREGQEYHKNIKYICDHDVLMLDDFGSTGITEWRQETLFSLIDERYESERPTIITTNIEPKNIHEIVGKRGADRLLAKENTIIAIGEEDCQSFRQVLD